MGDRFGAICPGKRFVVRNSVGDLFGRFCAGESAFLNCVDGGTSAVKQLTNGWTASSSVGVGDWPMPAVRPDAFIIDPLDTGWRESNVGEGRIRLGELRNCAGLCDSVLAAEVCLPNRPSVVG